MKKDFLDITDCSRKELYLLFDYAKKCKAVRKQGIWSHELSGCHIGLLFRKPSTRTRISFELAITELGGIPLYLAGESTQMSRGESVCDTAKIFSRYFHGLVVRTFSHQEIEDFARHSVFPVVNALTDFSHPCQALTDFFTIFEKKGSLDDLVVTYIGDPNNVSYSLFMAADILGVESRLSAPAELLPSKEFLQKLENPDLFQMSDDPKAFIADSDIVYTDTWVSMGDEESAVQKEALLRPYQVNKELFSFAKPTTLFMHCLPAHRGQEVTDEVLDSPVSIVFDQAENRLHCQKALLSMLFSSEKKVVE
jgi:ornithine carbamoyltransferase